MDIYQESLQFHKEHKGKLAIRSKVRIKTRHDLSIVYTPGVAEVSKQIASHPDEAYDYTMKSNSVAVVTDGSAVLGLGDIGGYGAIPVMEGKCILFKEFADIDAIPICFMEKSHDLSDQIKNISPVFGGINLEDIDSPRCFEIEEELQDIGIPVMHDDQHGTAVVVLAGLINACRVTGKRFSDLTVTLIGAGAAGYGITLLLKCLGTHDEYCDPVKEILVCDSKGIIHRKRGNLLENKYKYVIAHETNSENRAGSIEDALKGSDVLIGVSAPNIVTTEMVKSMNPEPIVLAMANPIPEIMPEEARSAGAAVVGTGRSDYPNQINNVLAFPGIFRGALDAAATRITDEMKLAAAHSLADYVKRPRKDHILPNVLDKDVTWTVARAVKQAALKCGCARIRK